MKTCCGYQWRQNRRAPLPAPASVSCRGRQPASRPQHLGVDAEVTLTPPCILCTENHCRNTQGGVRMTSTSGARSARGAGRAAAVAVGLIVYVQARPWFFRDARQAAQHRGGVVQTVGLGRSACGEQRPSRFDPLYARKASGWPKGCKLAHASYANTAIKG